MTLEACTACLLSEIVAGLSRRWCRPSQLARDPAGGCRVSSFET